MLFYSLDILLSVFRRVCLLAVRVMSVENLSSACMLGIRRELKCQFQAMPFPQTEKKFFEVSLLCRVLLFLLAQHWFL